MSYEFCKNKPETLVESLSDRDVFRSGGCVAESARARKSRGECRGGETGQTVCRPQPVWWVAGKLRDLVLGE